MKTTVVVTLALCLGGCGSFMEGWNAAEARRQEQIRQLAPILIVPVVPGAPQPGLFDYATGRKPGCTNITGYGVGC